MPYLNVTYTPAGGGDPIEVMDPRQPAHPAQVADAQAKAAKAKVLITRINVLLPQISQEAIDEYAMTDEGKDLKGFKKDLIEDLVAASPKLIKLFEDFDKPVGFAIKDSDPTSGIKLDVTLDYKSAWGEVIVESLKYREMVQDEIEKDKNKEPEPPAQGEVGVIPPAQEKGGTSLEGMLMFLDPEVNKQITDNIELFDTYYPLFASNLSTFTIKGELDEYILNNVPYVVNYLSTDQADNFTKLSLESTTPIPQSAVDYWNDSKNFSVKTTEALGRLDDIELKLLTNEGTDHDFAVAVAQYNTKKINLTYTDPVTGAVVVVDVLDMAAKEELAKAEEEAAKLDPESPAYYLPGGAGYDAVLKVASVGTAVKTIYVQAGKTVKIPYVAYANKGFKNKTVSLAWTSSKPKIANVKVTKKTGTITKNKKAGTVKTGKLDGKSVLTVKAAKKVGTSKITLKVNNKKKIVYVIKVVKKAKNVSAFKLGKVAPLKKGKAKAIKISKITKSATSGVATFTIAKKYQKYLTVDAAGKLVAKKAYQKGKKAIPVKIKVGKKTKTIKVKVK
jgi:hypothetical protein